MKPGSNAKQKHSVLLTKEENEQVINLLGPRCYSRSTTVIQLFCTDGPDGVYWNKKDVGVLCFVRDVNRRSYFFRLYNIAAKQMVWEHEIYNNMEYLAPKPFLHTFEAEDRIVAFNFANEDEAEHVRSVVIDQLKSKERRQLDPQNRNNPSHGRNSLSQAPSRPAPPPISSNGYVYPKSISLKSTSFTSKSEKKKSKKKSITKADIGIPQDFRHVSHVGWDPTSGFDLANVDTSMKQFFDKVGISENDLNDKETREFIYDFIEKHGGLDAVKMDIHHQSVPPPPSPPPPPPVPIRNAPPTHTLRSAPPPPPSRSVGSVHPAPPPPPSAPPPVNVLVQRNHEMQTKKLVSAPTTAASNAPPPPPPPPLPPPNLLVEENPTSNTMFSAPAQNVGPDPRAALMEAIRSGKALKHVENVEKESRKADDSREELLNQIRQGVELKSVQPVEKPNLPMDGLSGALARALAARAKMIHSDSSGSEESEDSDIDEWDDTIT